MTINARMNYIAVYSLRRVLPPVFCLLFAVHHGAGMDSGTDWAPPLLYALYSDDHAKREEAMRRLVAEGAERMQDIEQALAKTQDVDVRASLQRVLVEIRKINRWQADRTWFNKNVMPVFGASKLAPRDDFSADQDNGSHIVIANSMDEGLSWLVRTQEPDGHWNSQRYGAREKADVVQTALALIALHHLGNTTRAGHHRETVKKAVAFLVGAQTSTGSFREPEKEEVRDTELAIVAYALIMAYHHGLGDELRKAGKNALERVYDLWNTVNEKKRNRQDAPKANLITTAIRVLMIRHAIKAGFDCPEWVERSIIEEIKDCREADSARYMLSAGLKPTPEAEVLGHIAMMYASMNRTDNEAVLAIRGNVGEVMNTYPESVIEGKCGNDLVNYFAARLSLETGNEGDEFRHKLLTACCKRQIQGGEQKGAFRPMGEWGETGMVWTTALVVMQNSVRLRYIK